MIGKNTLWVAQQHGHSIATMLRAYAAWAEGSVEMDIDLIKHAMNLTSPRGESATLSTRRATCRVTSNRVSGGGVHSTLWQ